MTKKRLIVVLWDLVQRHKGRRTCTLGGELRNVVKAAKSGAIERPYLSSQIKRKV